MDLDSNDIGYNIESQRYFIVMLSVPELIVGVQKSGAGASFLAMAQRSRAMHPLYARRAYRSTDLAKQVGEYRLLRRKIKEEKLKERMRQQAPLKQENDVRRSYDQNQLLELEYRLKTSTPRETDQISGNRQSIPNPKNRQKNLTLFTEHSPGTGGGSSKIRKRIHTVQKPQQSIQQQASRIFSKDMVHPKSPKRKTLLRDRLTRKPFHQTVLKKEQLSIGLEESKLQECFHHLHSRIFAATLFDSSRKIEEAAISHFLSTIFRLEQNVLKGVQKDESCEEEETLLQRTILQLYQQKASKNQNSVFEKFSLHTGQGLGLLSDQKLETNYQKKTHVYQEIKLQHCVSLPPDYIMPSNKYQQNHKVCLKLNEIGKQKQTPNPKKIEKRKGKNNLFQSSNSNRIFLAEKQIKGNERYLPNIDRKDLKENKTHRLDIPYSDFSDRQSAKKSIQKIINMPLRDAINLCFQIYDKDRDGVIGHSDLLQLLYLSASLPQLTQDLSILVKETRSQINFKSSLQQSDIDLQPKSLFQQSFSKRVSTECEPNRIIREIQVFADLRPNGRISQSKMIAKGKHAIRVFEKDKSDGRISDSRIIRKRKVTPSRQSPRRFFFMKPEKVNRKEGVDLKRFRELFDVRPAAFYLIVKKLFGIKKHQYFLSALRLQSPPPDCYHPFNQQPQTPIHNSQHISSPFTNNDLLIKLSSQHLMHSTIKGKKISKGASIKEKTFEQQWEQKIKAAKQYLILAKKGNQTKD